MNETYTRIEAAAAIAADECRRYLRAHALFLRTGNVLANVRVDDAHNNALDVLASVAPGQLDLQVRLAYAVQFALFDYTGSSFGVFVVTALLRGIQTTTDAPVRQSLYDFLRDSLQQRERDDTVIVAKRRRQQLQTSAFGRAFLAVLASLVVPTDDDD